MRENHEQTRPELAGNPDAIIASVRELRSLDAPTHGGRVLSYVYDTGISEIDDLAGDVARIVQPLNALDPTTFPSVAVMESDLIAFAREMLHGGNDVAGNVTSGGTESCLLAVRTARDLWRVGRDRFAIGRIVAPTTVHAAFRKAAKYFDMILDEVPVDPATGQVSAADVIERMGDDVALVVLSTPNYPYAGLDPVAEVAPVALERGIALHVDACIGGFALPWWKGVAHAWDFAVPGVTSISADLHKYGFAPKGASVLLHKGHARHRAQYFSITDWPGYPVVNPTMLGSKSAAPIASAWAIVQYLGTAGFAEQVALMQTATAELVAGLNQIEGLRVQGEPTGPLLAVVADESVAPDRRVNPHKLVDDIRASGWILQSQPGQVQTDGTLLPQSAHLTITPVTHGKTGDLLAAISASADRVRGAAGALESPMVLGGVAAIKAQFAALGVGENGEGLEQVPAEVMDQALAGLLLALGVGGSGGAGSEGVAGSGGAGSDLTGSDLTGSGAGSELPANMSDLLAIAQLLPEPIATRILTEVLAQVIAP
ncbi:aspartate aminotransferase family protein [Timonella senegalensis]|uniref:pyridoxal phosphate-dependent decarboxylase family protein n=1 Tax=Timonella senegalensis TaxID=1465825 RepID=UPI002FDCA149